MGEDNNSVDKKFRLSLKMRENLTGYMFILPFIIGFFLFFFYPFIQSIVFSLSELELTTSGFSLDFIGMENYNEALLVHPSFVQTFYNTLMRMANDIPLIIIFSFIIANILNQKFRGRFLARVIFFLPVILTARVLYNIEQGSYIQQVMSLTEITSDEGILSTVALQQFLINLKLPQQFVEYIIYAIERLPQVINSSAIPILIFLAALQSMPSSIYEAAYIEGATKWETFWKITFPMISSFILVNLVYLFVDSFTNPENQLVNLMRDEAWGGAGYGVSTAMAWVYFIIIFIILGTIILFISRYIYYEN